MLTEGLRNKVKPSTITGGGTSWDAQSTAVESGTAAGVARSTDWDSGTMLAIQGRQQWGSETAAVGSGTAAVGFRDGSSGVQGRQQWGSGTAAVGFRDGSSGFRDGSSGVQGRELGTQRSGFPLLSAQRRGHLTPRPVDIGACCRPALCTNIGPRPPPSAAVSTTHVHHSTGCPSLPAD